MAVSTILQSTLAAIGLIAAAQAGAETTIVTAARMLDVEKGAIVERPTIVVTDGRIAAIATRADAPAAAGDEKNRHSTPPEL